MAFKFIVFAAFVAVANAGVLPFAPLPYAPAAHLTYGAPIAQAVVAKTVEYDAHPQYTYAYDVHDTLTGDAKSQHESRDGDVVKGSYSLIEADGTRRVVDYTADSIHGFNAVVHKEPATVAYKAVAAAPIVHAAPVAHAAPLAYKTIAAAPLAYKTIAPAPLAYNTIVAAPAAHVAHLAYAAPVAHASTLSYATPIAKYTDSTYASHVAYAAPAASYVH